MKNWDELPVSLVDQSAGFLSILFPLESVASIVSVRFSSDTCGTPSTRCLGCTRHLPQVIDVKGGTITAAQGAQIRYAIENLSDYGVPCSQQQGEKKAGSQAHRLGSFGGRGYSITKGRGVETRKGVPPFYASPPGRRLPGQA